MSQSYACYHKDCVVKLETFDELIIHVNTAHSGEILVCPYENCKSKLKSSIIQRHMNRMHEGKIVKGSYLGSNLKKVYACYNRNCMAKLKSIGELFIHINELHGGKVSCPYENCQSILNSSTIRKHINKIHEKKSCEHCGEVIVKSKKLIHSCTNNKLRNFHCSTENCKASFASKLQLLSHVNKVHRLQIKCHYKDCNSWIKPASLIAHIEAVHEKLKQTCQLCGKKISYKNFNAHKERCTNINDEKKFPCTFNDCQEIFTSKYNRSSHITRKHKNKLPIKCPRENCGAMMLRQYLTRHVKETHDKLKGECKFCNKEFTISNMRRHENRCEKLILKLKKEFI